MPDMAIVLTNGELLHEYAARLTRERDELRALLREIEWVDRLDGQRRCPLCGGQPDGPFKGHIPPDCRLKAALEERDARL